MIGETPIIYAVPVRDFLRRINRNAMPSFTIHVDNLKCGGCASTVRHRVQELPGVSGVWVDPPAGTVRVEHDGSAEHDQVIALLQRLGYPEEGTGGTIEKVKSYVSCAIGRLHGED